MDERACHTSNANAIVASCCGMIEGHAQLWTALTSLATALVGAFRYNRGRIRKLQREVDTLKMQIEIHRQLLAANGMSYDRRRISRE